MTEPFELFEDMQGLPGYRLHRLEVMNWGTFDSTDGSIYSVSPKGRASLLVGKNGSGKSTLVDALLTLLVRPGLRSYNLAAGSTGKRRERNESSYIRGAYGHSSSEHENKATTLYLRGDRSWPSILLAYFENEDINRGFTIAQYLYLKDQSVERVYCFAKGDKSIKDNFAAISSGENLLKQIKGHGFEATRSFSQYHKRIVGETKMQGKAMDIFNQTVSVKDIRSLTGFIRDHMLERSNRKEEVAEILQHFDQLTEAHDVLVQARKQLEALEPVAEAGEHYYELSRELNEQKRLLEASQSFFRQQSIDIYEAAREQWFDEQEIISQQLDTLGQEIAEIEKRLRKLENDRDNAGSERLREIPTLIDSHTFKADAKQKQFNSFRSELRAAGIDDPIRDETGFINIGNRLVEVKSDAETRLSESGERLLDAQLRRRVCREEREHLETEIRGLMDRRTKLPGNFADLRASLCEDLCLDPQLFPYAAELIAVRGDQRDWEPAAEMVLRSFGLSLLVPENYYREVSRYVNKTKLIDHRGQGQRLIYLKITEDNSLELNRPDQHSRSLWHKLEFKMDHPLGDWVSTEVARRFGYRCCDELEEFQTITGQAITKERQVKRGAVQHEKDDRRRVMDPRNWVLGWDFKAKLALLRQDYQAISDEINQLDQTITSLRSAEAKYRKLINAAEQALKVKSYSDIDYESENVIISNLIAEKERLEAEDDRIQALAKEIQSTEGEKQKAKEKEHQLVEKNFEIKNHLEQAGELIGNAMEILAASKEANQLYLHEEVYPVIIEQLEIQGTWPLTVDNVTVLESQYRNLLQKQVNKLQEDINPMRIKVTRAMGRFLNEFSHLGHDQLRDDPENIADFLAIRDRLINDDLPRYEDRFRERLVENVAQEIGIFRSKLANAADEIVRKIELLNNCLAEIDYNRNPDTVMKLEPLPVSDPEIREFRRDLNHCLDGYKSGTTEAMEECFGNIKSLIERLSQDPSQWEKLIDVRRWFDFAAREIERDTEKERGYFTDSMGQSGGEKAKLAFTILVAAVVYQFDIDKRSSTSQRFHFVMVDEMFSKVDDAYAEYAMRLFESFGLQLLIVAPFDAKAKVTEPFVEYYLHVVKQEDRSEVYTMTAQEFAELESA